MFDNLYNNPCKLSLAIIVSVCQLTASCKLVSSRLCEPIARSFDALWRAGELSARFSTRAFLPLKC